MLVIGSGRFRAQILWAAVFLIVTVASAAWYGLESWRWGEALGGSSFPGIVFGTVAAGLILFEMALWLRKRVRARRYLGRAQAWMRAHIWLGLLTVPLVLLHSGFRLGSPLTTILAVVFAVVIASGVWGLVMQHWLPTKMYKDLPLETIYTQIDHVGKQMSKEAEQLVIQHCGNAGIALDRSHESSASFLLLGAKSVSSGSLSGVSLQTITSLHEIAEPSLLASFFVGDIHPYLTNGRRSGSPLANEGYARRAFDQLRGRLEPATHRVIDRLAEVCKERRQLDRQQRLHAWLHNWLLIHMPVSVALVLLLALHIWVAFKYW